MATDPIRLADLHGLPIEISTDHEADAYAEAHGSDFDA